MNKGGAYQPPLASQHGHLHMAEDRHPALVHEVANGGGGGDGGGRRDPRREPQHKTAASSRSCRWGARAQGALRGQRSGGMYHDVAQGRPCLKSKSSLLQQPTWEGA